MAHRKLRTPAHELRKRAALAKGVAEFNAREFYECHETLEEVWLEDGTGDVLFLQGLIQAAAAYHNLLRGKWGGGERLLRLAAEKLAPFGEEHLGVALGPFVATLHTHREHALRLLRGGGGPWREEWLPELQLRRDSPASD